MDKVEELNAKVALHDAVLLGIELLWAEGTVTVGVKATSGPKRIVVQQVTRLVCPREYPWGRSVCINEVRFRTPSGARLQLEIEMQSGDVIEICGGQMDVDG
jgi:hypothetical protein